MAWIWTACFRRGRRSGMARISRLCRLCQAVTLHPWRPPRPGADRRQSGQHHFDMTSSALSRHLHSRALMDLTGRAAKSNLRSPGAYAVCSGDIRDRHRALLGVIGARRFRASCVIVLLPDSRFTSRAPALCLRRIVDIVRRQHTVANVRSGRRSLCSYVCAQIFIRDPDTRSADMGTPARACSSCHPCML
jgi:hypothetical protein